MKKVSPNELIQNYIKLKKVKNLKESGKTLNSYIDELFELNKTKKTANDKSKKEESSNKKNTSKREDSELNLEKYKKIENIKLMNEIRKFEAEINKQLINEDLTKAKEIYRELKDKYKQYPDKDSELKSQIFGDLLSFNLRIHQLRGYKDKLEKIKQEKQLSDSEENVIRKNEINKEKKIIQQETMPSLETINKDKEVKTEKENKNEKTNKPITPETIKENENKEIKNRNQNKETKDIKTKELIQDIDIRKNDIIFIDEEQEIISKEPVKMVQRMILDNPEKTKCEKEHQKKYITINQSKQMINQLMQRKKELIKKLYFEGLKNMNEKNKKQAEAYFNKILEIQPNYKPAIIRLEELNV